MENDDLVTYVSQVQLHTDLIRQTVVDHGEMEVTCAASSKTASVLLDIQGMKLYSEYDIKTSVPCSQ